MEVPESSYRDEEIWRLLEVDLELVLEAARDRLRLEVFWRYLNCELEVETGDFSKHGLIHQDGNGYCLQLALQRRLGRVDDSRNALNVEVNGDSDKVFEELIGSLTILIAAVLDICAGIGLLEISLSCGPIVIQSGQRARKSARHVSCRRWFGCRR